MKINTYFFAVISFFLLGNISAQTPASAILNINNVKAQINANGALFTDFNGGQFIAPYEAGQPEISTLRASGIWLAGLDPGGNLKGAIHAYNEDQKADFQPGPLDDDDISPLSSPAGIYRVTSADIEEHLADLSDNGIIDNPNPNVFGWPAIGNPYFSQYNNGETLPVTNQGLADFWDKNGDAFYDPTDGDIPIISVRGCETSGPVYADEMLWFVFNDNLEHTESGMLPLQMEVQCQIFAFNCNEAPLGNSIFVKYKLINRAKENLESAYFGVFADFDIGNPNDDFFGSDSLQSSIFAYNGDEDDEGGYGSQAPVMSVDMLRGPLDESGNELSLSHVMPIGANLPSAQVGFYNLLKGRNENGSALPNNGFFFTGDPNDPTAWSEVSETNEPGDRKVVGSYGPFRLFPGAINELVVAYTFHQEPDNTPLENVATMYEQTEKVQNLFDDCFDISSTVECTPSPTGLFELKAGILRVYPNPTSETITIELPETLQGAISLIDLNGRLMFSTKHPPGNKKMQMDVRDFPPGMYVVIAQNTDGSIFRQKIVLSDF